MKTKLFLSLSLLTAAFTVINATDSDACLQSTLSAFENEGGKVVSTPAQTGRFAQFTFANAKAAMTSTNAKFGAITALGTVGTLAAIGGVGEYVKAREAQAEAKALADRSYFAKASDYVSGLAQSAKANTWDSNYGFNHSGKVATVAGVAAVAGLSYLAYKKNPFGRAVEKTVKPTVPAPSSARKLSRI